MTEKKWCLNCKKMITPIKEFSCWFFVLSLCLICCIIGIPMIIGYIIYYNIKDRDKCPRCKSKRLIWDKPEEPIVQNIVSEDIKYCSMCGNVRVLNAKYCSFCGEVI